MVSGYFVTTKTSDDLHLNTQTISKTYNAGITLVKNNEVPTKTSMDKKVSKATGDVANVVDKVVAVKRIVYPTGVRLQVD